MSSTPVVVITGFLGAGKTTLLNQLLRDPDFADSAILINEFGSVAIDHDLIAEFSADAIVTTSGCLCCSMGSDILQSLQKLATRESAGEIRRFKRVIVETTGLADPVPVINTLLAALPPQRERSCRRPHVRAGAGRGAVRHRTREEYLRSSRGSAQAVGTRRQHYHH
jgi:G3E family GTPase